MKADLDAWRQLYPQVRGVFFDEQANTTAALGYCAGLEAMVDDAGFDRSRVAVIAYGVAFDAGYVPLVAAETGWLYLTGDTVPNPYDSFPSYLDAQPTALGLSP